MEFTYNSTTYSLTSMSPFSIVYQKVPQHLLNLAKLSIGEKFSNAASAMAEQDINVQKEIRTRLRNSIQDTKPLLIKGGENRSSKKETWCRLSKNH